MDALICAALWGYLASGLLMLADAGATVVPGEWRRACGV
jgi:hypothetical protein